MKIIDHNTIAGLQIPYAQQLDWVENVFKLKSSCILPPKISLPIIENGFFNTMPSVIPSEDCFGAKIVTRYPSRIPSLQSQLFLYQLSSGEFKAVMDATWITAARTGAVAALSVKYFAKTHFSKILFIGLGNTARSTFKCLKTIYSSKNLTIGVVRYKNQAESFIQEFQKDVPSWKFIVMDDIPTSIKWADVVISCVTVANNIFAEDAYFTKGVTVIPVHTKGFQNCDLFFDKFFVDDISHVEHFKNYNIFKERMSEFSEVIKGNVKGRENDEERILCYNIGIGLHDIYFANKICRLCEERKINMNVSELGPKLDKFWY